MANDINSIIVSVVVPIYNVGKYITKCLESIVVQIDQDMELILVDDGSSDNCPAICDEYARNYKNVRVIHKVNGGLVSARKAGVNAASGEYVTFVDGDDWIDAGYFSKIKEIITEYNPDIISITKHYRAIEGKEPYVFQENDLNGMYDRAMLEEYIFPGVLYTAPYYSFGISPSLCAKVIKREILSANIHQEPDEIRMGEDLAVSLPCILQANSVYFSNICGYFYRMNPKSITHTFDPESPKRIKCLIEYLNSKIGTYDQFGMKNQLAVYSVHILSYTVSMLIKGSANMKEDLDKLSPLISCDIVKQGLKNKLPLKIKMLILSARKKRILLLKMIRKRWLKKEKKGF